MNVHVEHLNMTETEFKAIVDIAYVEAGLVFPPEKASLVSTRIRKRVRSLGLSGFSDYIALVNSASGEQERRTMISSLTTNVSKFFRENHHFEYLKTEILPELINRAKRGERIRLWSAGCSTGQEPYSLALTALSVDVNLDRYDIKILATDIDENVIKTGQSGFYPERSRAEISAHQLTKFLLPFEKNQETGFILSDKVRNLVSFRELNLLKPWPFSGYFDVIFCRNVVIYFDQITQKKLWTRFEESLNENGWLFVGHSERFSEGSNTNFHLVGPTTYQLRTPKLNEEED